MTFLSKVTVKYSITNIYGKMLFESENMMKSDMPKIPEWIFIWVAECWWILSEEFASCKNFLLENLLGFIQFFSFYSFIMLLSRYSSNIILIILLLLNLLMFFWLNPHSIMIRTIWFNSFLIRNDFWYFIIILLSRQLWINLSQYLLSVKSRKIANVNRIILIFNLKIFILVLICYIVIFFNSKSFYSFVTCFPIIHLALFTCRH